MIIEIQKEYKNIHNIINSNKILKHYIKNLYKNKDKEFYKNYKLEYGFYKDKNIIDVIKEDIDFVLNTKENKNNWYEYRQLIKYASRNYSCFKNYFEN